VFSFECVLYRMCSLSMTCPAVKLRGAATTLLCAENILRLPALLLPSRHSGRQNQSLHVSTAAAQENYWHLPLHTHRHLMRLPARACRTRRLDPGRESGEPPAALTPHAPRSPATARLALAWAHRRRGRTEVGRKRPHILTAMPAK